MVVVVVKVRNRGKITDTATFTTLITFKTIYLSLITLTQQR